MRARSMVPIRFVVSYDMADDIRRSRVQAILLGCGRRVQESVFECRLTPTQWRRVRRRVQKAIDAGEDAVRWYPVCSSCHRVVPHIDVLPDERDEGCVVV